MNSLKNSPYYCEAIHELEYDFGIFYLFNNFVIAEIKPGIILNWDNHVKKFTEDIREIYGNNGENIIYISNRIHEYSIVPSDWIKFYRNNYQLKGYATINYTKGGYVNSLLEKLFVKSLSKKFNSLEHAINWANEISDPIHYAS